MEGPLARLRSDLDFMPSPVEDRPGLLIRDPHQYSDATLIIPPPLIECLQHFNGEDTALDLRASLVRIADSLDVGELLDHLVTTFRDSGFLEDGVFARLRDDAHRRFAEAPRREASHAGGAYPDEPELLKQTLDRYLEGSKRPASANGLVGIAAPHVSPEGGWQSFGAAYGALSDDLADRTFVILGTSHYGEPDRFGLTRKPFATPYGVARTDVELVDRLASSAPEAVAMEDYCHSTEHSIEFQVVFLQHVFGPEVRILPILCGSYARSLHEGGNPEDNPDVSRFLQALSVLANEEKERLFWVLGIDLAHMGRRYGDSFKAVAGEGAMREVSERDSRRIERVNAGDAEGFWELVRERKDDLKWCGSSPLYTFMKALPQVRSQLLRYDQWNIDDESVVTFGALTFHA